MHDSRYMDKLGLSKANFACESINMFSMCDGAGTAAYAGQLRWPGFIPLMPMAEATAGARRIVIAAYGHIGWRQYLSSSTGVAFR